jgi:hypothetical protein
VNGQYQQAFLTVSLAQRLLSRYSDLATDRPTEERWLDSSHGRRDFLQSIQTRSAAHLPGAVKRATYLHQLLRLRMRGVIPSPPAMSSWRRQGQLYFPITEHTTICCTNAQNECQNVR